MPVRGVPVQPERHTAVCLTILTEKWSPVVTWEMGIMGQSENLWIITDRL
jgi:ubiquitin-protein ligase